MTRQSLGKFFFIRHVYSNMVLEVQQGERGEKGSGAGEKAGSGTGSGGSGSAVNAVVTGYQLPVTDQRDHQLWYVDQATSTIRSKYQDLCIDLKDDKVIVNTFQRRSARQRWVIRGSRIQSKDETDSVIGLVDSPPQEGSPAYAVDSDGSEGQQWDCEHTTAEYFYIRSQSDSERVLEVAGNDESPGAKVQLCANKNQMNDCQLWYEDENGVIRSKLNDFALTASTKGLLTQEEEVFLQPYHEENDRQQWIVSGSSLQNRLNSEEVLETRGGGWFTNPYVVPSEYNGGSPQLWSIDYIPNQVMSLSHPGIGKYVRIQSKLSGHFLTVRDGDVEPGTDIILYDRKSELREANDQLWYIDDSSGTIRSALHDYCLDLNDNHLIVNPFNIESRTQQWKVIGMKIYCACHPEKALQVEGNSEDLGVKVTISLFRGVTSQLWDVQYVPARCFFIKSFACDKVMTVKNAWRDSGAQTALCSKLEEVCTSQLWYEDEQGYIRSALNGYMIDTNEEGLAKLRPYKPGDKNQHWQIMEDTIQHRHDHKQVLDTKRGWTLEGTSIIAAKYVDERSSQTWYSEYL